jgi:hypothetical protein
MKKHIIKIVLLVVGVVVCLGTVVEAGVYGGGTGTAEDPYQIWTAEQMNEIGLNLDDWDKYFILAADIDLSGYPGDTFHIIGRQIPIEYSLGVAVNPSTGKVYWSDGYNSTVNSNLFRADTVTFKLDRFDLDKESRVGRICLDIDGGKIYWIDSSKRNIQCANLDGTEVEELFDASLYYPYDLELDLSEGKLYFSDYKYDTIFRLNLDGTGFEEIVITGMGSPRGIAVDPVIKKVYWIDTDTHKIQRSNLDGTEVEDIFIAPESYPIFLEINADAGKIYWYDSGTRKFHRSNFDGSEVEDLFSSASTYVNDMFLDTFNSKIYWTNRVSVVRANIDGTEIEDIGTLPAFSGVFDGNGYTISSFQYDGIEEKVGLFGRVEGVDALIQNVTLIDPNVVSVFNAIDATGCLAGYLTGRATIQNCYVKNGSVYSLTRFAGGLCGGNRGIIADCVVEDTIVQGQDYTGGLSGSNTSNFGRDYEGITRNCHFSGDVFGGEYVGGLIGLNTNHIYSSSSAGSVKGLIRVGGLTGCWGEDYGIIEDCLSDCLTEGQERIGGLIGSVGSGGTATSGYVSRCKSIGPVIGTGGAIGGLIGAASYGHIKNSCAIGSVRGQSSVGGLIGYSNAIVTNCYSEGRVTAADVSGGLIGSAGMSRVYYSYSTSPVSGTTVGGLFGRDGSAVDCYWDVEASGVSISSGGIGLTTLEMKMYETYLNWECQNAWTIDEGIDYPRLVWEEQPGIPIVKVYNYGGGSGTEDDPYLINTAEHLYMLGMYYYCDLDKYFLQTADIDMSEYDGLYGREEFPMIGTSNLPFIGVYDGNDFTISNLTINSDRHLVGLFGVIGEYKGHHNDEILIKDIYLENANIESTETCVGGIAGLFRGGEITNCNVSSNSTIKGYSMVGGIVGKVTSDSIWAGTYINDCFVEATVQAYSYGGGIAGDLTGYVNGCEFYGTVTGTSFLGGICGIGGSVLQCLTNATIQGEEDYIGGISGKNEGLMSENLSHSSVSGRSRIGGISGSNEGWVISCYSTGPVSGTYDSVGGLIGYSRDSKIEECYSNGTVLSDGTPGGLLGYRGSSCQIINSFWDIESSGVTTSAGGEGKTSEEMKQYETFITWECSDNWTINVCVESPRLFWENAEGIKITPSNYGGGSGEIGDPYLLYSADDLYKITITDCHMDKHFKVMADIDMSGYNGQEGNPEFSGISAFDGTFDGNGHTISNYTSSCSLFPSLQFRGVLRNIRMENVQLVFGEKSKVCGVMTDYSKGVIENCSVVGGNISGFGYVGGLIGYSYHALIKNCCTDVLVQGAINPDSSGYGFGGLIGAMGIGDVLNSYANGDVLGDIHVGGLIGSVNSGTFVNCYSSGQVTGNDYVGGFVGRNNSGTFYGCFWDTETSGQLTSAGGEGKTTGEMETLSTFKDAGWDFIDDNSDGLHETWMMAEGGGYPVLSIFNSYTPSVLSGNGSPETPYEISTAEELAAVYYYPINGYYVLNDNIDLSAISWKIAPIPFFHGNFDGRGHSISNMKISGNDYLALFGKISKNQGLSDVKIVDVKMVGADIVGNNTIGVLAACNYGEVSRCSSSGNIHGLNYVGGLIGDNREQVSECLSSATVEGNERVGGLVGSNFYRDATIDFCSSKAKVFGNWRVGGLLGYSYKGEMSNCYSISEVTGVDQVGGLTGMFYDGRLRNSYAAGQVTGENQVGELCGYLTYDVWKYCYYLDIETIIGSRGIPLTDEQMKQEESFENWDFVNETANGEEDIWFIKNNSHYPKLWWENNAPVANAGTDQFIIGAGSVTLDGSQSYDLDGDSLSYHWRWEIEETVYEVNEIAPTIQLPVGEHEIELIVNDGIIPSEPDYVTIHALDAIECQLSFNKDTLSLEKGGQRLKATLVFPEGFTEDMIDETYPVSLEPGGIHATAVRVQGDENKQLTLGIIFEKAGILQEYDLGSSDVVVVGMLKDGRYFAGSGTIQIVP